MSPVKEPKYFTAISEKLDFNGPGDKRVIQDTVTTENAYLDLFKGAGEGQLLGEASTIYLSSLGTAERMAAEVPHARLIAVLRHPADRAFSAFMHLRRDGYETLESFEDALDAESERIRQGYYYHWHLRSRGYYGRYLATYYDHFPREQIKVILYEDFAASPGIVLADIFRFLGVDDSFMPDTSARHNQSGIPHSRSVQKFLTGSHPVKEWLKNFVPERLGHRVISMMQPSLVSRPGMSPRIRARLTEDYCEDIIQLQELIRMDLSHWLEEK